MCGRGKLTASPEEIQAIFSLHETPNLPPHFNIAPTQPIAVVRTPGELEQLRFGLVPPWSRDPKDAGARFLNARSETVATLAAYREAFAKRRCLVVLDGFYEWKKLGKSKQPYVFQMPDGKPFAIGGVWDRWTSHATGEVIESVAVITVAAPPPHFEVHDRMPLVLPRDAWSAWLDPSTADPARMLTQPEAPLIANPVSTAVNNPRNDGPECMEPPQRRLFDV
jgi:putative SOS response-associated peptidase YedK